MPPSEATSQYPFPDGVAAIPVTGRFRWMAPVEPKERAAPNAKMVPAAPASAARAGAVTGAARGARPATATAATRAAVRRRIRRASFGENENMVIRSVRAGGGAPTIPLLQIPSGGTNLLPASSGNL